MQVIAVLLGIVLVIGIVMVLVQAALLSSAAWGVGVAAGAVVVTVIRRARLRSITAGATSNSLLAVRRDTMLFSVQPNANALSEFATPSMDVIPGVVVGGFVAAVALMAIGSERLESNPMFEMEPGVGTGAAWVFTAAALTAWAVMAFRRGRAFRVRAETALREIAGPINNELQSTHDLLQETAEIARLNRALQLPVADVYADTVAKYLSENLEHAIVDVRPLRSIIANQTERAAAHRREVAATLALNEQLRREWLAVSQHALRARQYGLHATAEATYASAEECIRHASADLEVTKLQAQLRNAISDLGAVSDAVAAVLRGEIAAIQVDREFYVKCRHRSGWAFSSACPCPACQDENERRIEEARRREAERVRYIQLRHPHGWHYDEDCDCSDCVAETDRLWYERIYYYDSDD